MFIMQRSRAGFAILVLIVAAIFFSAYVNEQTKDNPERETLYERLTKD